MSLHHIQHVLTLHLYQPPGALHRLLLESEAELQRVLKCYERIGRYTHKYADVARLHVVFSTSLLQQLKDPVFIEQTRHLEDIPGILESFRNAPNIEFIASGLYHAPLPLTPRQDWDAQLRTERSLIEDSFGHQPKGYFPPGGLFDEAMIPHLTAAGYRFALLPQTTLTDGAGNPVDPYRIYQLTDDFVVVPVDDGFSRAQEHFIEAPWFADEVVNGTRIAPESSSPYLVTTCSDGENGDWYRRSDEENGFFGHFFAPYMEFCETGEYPIRPVSVIEYLQHAKPEKAKLAKQETPAREHSALQRLHSLSRQYWEKTRHGVTVDPGIHEQILQAEGSCFVFDPDPEYQKLTSLLNSISQKLETVAPAQAAGGSNQVSTPASGGSLRAPASAQLPGNQVATKETASRTTGTTTSAAEKTRPANSATAANRKNAVRKKKAAVRKRATSPAKKASPKRDKGRSE